MQPIKMSGGTLTRMLVLRLIAVRRRIITNSGYAMDRILED